MSNYGKTQPENDTGIFPTREELVTNIYPHLVKAGESAQFFGEYFSNKEGCTFDFKVALPFQFTDSGAIYEVFSKEVNLGDCEGMIRGYPNVGSRSYHSLMSLSKNNVVIDVGRGTDITPVWDKKTWKRLDKVVEYTLRNQTEKDVIVYCREVNGEFQPISNIRIQDKISESWKVSDPKTELLTTGSQSERIVKPNGSLNFKEYVSSHSDCSTERQIAVLTSKGKSKSLETIYSEPRFLSCDYPLPYVAVSPPNSESVSEKILDKPQCSLKLSESPSIRGVQLGMKLVDFKEKFPNARISTHGKNNYTYKLAAASEWNGEVQTLIIGFINDEVGKMWVKFRSLKGLRHRKDFRQLLGQTLGLHPFFEMYGMKFECHDFVVEVLTNDEPDIYIETKDYRKFQRRLSEEYDR